MITLHTIENVYAGNWQYYQFAQHGSQPLLDSKALCRSGNLRDFLQYEIIESLGLEDERFDRTLRLLQRTLEAGEVVKLLGYAERVSMRDSDAEHASMTYFGEWTFDSLVLEPPASPDKSVPYIE